MSTSSFNLGKIIITPRGAWSNQVEYKRLDLIYAIDGSYIALKDNKGVNVTDGSTWQMIAGRGPAGSGNVSVVEAGLKTGKKYFFVPSTDNSAEGTFQEFTPDTFNQQQADWNQTQTNQPDFIKNKPELFSGNYNNLTNKPNLFSGSYNDLTEKPPLFNGNYNDLHNKPESLPASGGHAATSTKSFDSEKLGGIESSLYSFISGSKTITSLASLVLDKQINYANLSSNQSISVTSRVVDGQPSHIYVTNTTVRNLTIAIPTTGNYISMSGASKILPPSGYLEISIAYDANISKYRIATLESE